MAKSDARFGYRAKLARNDHDLSREFGFTCCPGQLLPIFADVATPGDAYYIKHDLTFLRTAPLAAPAMVDVKVHYETFFVPMQMLYQPFENTVFSLKALQSSNFDVNNLRNNYFPVFNYGAFVTLMTGSVYQRSSNHLNSFRLADMLDLNADNFAFDSSHPSRYSYTPSFFPWQILAYHCLYEYFYRLDDKTAFDNSRFNFDKYYGQAQPVTIIDPMFMSIHHRPWRFDYFTSMYWGAIVNDSNLQSVLPSDYYSDLSSTLTTLNIDGSGTGSSNNESVRAFSNYYGTQYNYTQQRLNASTVAIRQMFANEKLAMISGRTKKTYDSQVLAHFGVEVPHDVKHDISLIGSDHYPLHIGEVTSLASTSDSALGDLAGKGWAQSPSDIKTHKFVAPCHGVVMTIFSIEPTQRYYGGFNRINSCINAFDIPTPEFDRLGNMPMFRYEAGSLPQGASDSDIIGWKERYYFNKRRSPKTTLAFEDASSGLYANYSNSYSAYMISTQPFSHVDISHQSFGRPDLNQNYYISSHAMDYLMLVPYQGTWVDGTGDGETENWNATPWLAYARDPFIVDSYEKVTKVSWMSKDGEPIYD